MSIVPRVRAVPATERRYETALQEVHTAPDDIATESPHRRDWTRIVNPCDWSGSSAISNKADQNHLAIQYRLPPPDAVGRLVGQKLTERLRQAIIIENRPGGGTTIATKAGATAEPDGYTLLHVNASLAYSTVLYRNPGYDPIKSFAPVAALASWSHLLVVPADVPAGKLVAYAKTNPAQANIGFPLGTIAGLG